MAKDLHFTLLLDVYGPLLTEKQRETLDFYYNEDLSLGEISEETGITRQGVMNCIKKCEQRLLELEDALGKEAVKNMLPMQPGDVYQTNADTARLEAAVGYRPHISLHEGIGHFVQWYLSDMNPLR